jgi:hypothetical protein
LITVLTLVLLLPKIRVLAAVVVGVALIVAVALAEKPIPLPDTPPPVLEISQKEVVAGQDSYTLRIESLSGSLISLRFSINDEKPVEYDVPLNALGEIEFDVPAETRKGTYRFLAFRKARDSAWIEANVSIVVR